MREKKRPHFKNQQTPKQGKATEQPKARRLSIDLFGTHAVEAAWKNPKRFIHALYITQSALKDFDTSGPVKRPSPTIVDKEDLDKSLPPGTVHQGIALSCQALEDVSLTDLIIKSSTQSKSILLMLDQVTDPQNIGAILRSSCAFGASGMILQKKHAPDINGVMAKTACGAVEHVPIAYETNLSRCLEMLKDEGYTCIALDERGEKTIEQIPQYEKTVLILGAEGPGIRRLVKENCDILARLPMAGPMPSINVSNAAAVALYALSVKVGT